MASYAVARRPLAVVVLVMLLAQCTDSGQDRVDLGSSYTGMGMTGSDGRSRRALPANAPVDYQIGGDYEPPIGVEVVVRDWFSGRPLADGYSICYVNGFQTEDDVEGVDRPDERSRWPSELVLAELGDDPDWVGEYLIDLSTAERRQAAAEWVDPMVKTCADKGFDAVEFDNLDSWTRFTNSPLAAAVPFAEAEAAAYATLLTAAAHARGMAAAQKNTLEFADVTVDSVGFDFLIVERCGELDECEDAANLYGDQVLAVEYETDGFQAACDAIGAQSSVVLRDVAVSRPGSKTYIYDEC